MVPKVATFNPFACHPRVDSLIVAAPNPIETRPLETRNTKKNAETLSKRPTETHPKSTIRDGCQRTFLAADSSSAIY